MFTNCSVLGSRYQNVHTSNSIDIGSAVSIEIFITWLHNQIRLILQPCFLFPRINTPSLPVDINFLFGMFSSSPVQFLLLFGSLGAARAIPVPKPDRVIAHAEHLRRSDTSYPGSRLLGDSRVAAPTRVSPSGSPDHASDSIRFVLHNPPPCASQSRFG